MQIDDNTRLFYPKQAVFTDLMAYKLASLETSRGPPGTMGSPLGLDSLLDWGGGWANMGWLRSGWDCSIP